MMVREFIPKAKFDKVAEYCVGGELWFDIAEEKFIFRVGDIEFEAEYVIPPVDNSKDYYIVEGRDGKQDVAYLVTPDGILKLSNLLPIGPSRLGVAVKGSSGREYKIANYYIMGWMLNLDWPVEKVWKFETDYSGNIIDEISFPVALTSKFTEKLDRLYVVAESHEEIYAITYLLAKFTPERIRGVLFVTSDDHLTISSKAESVSGVWIKGNEAMFLPTFMDGSLYKGKVIEKSEGEVVIKTRALLKNIKGFLDSEKGHYIKLDFANHSIQVYER